MFLIGQFDSPFVRRVAIALRHYDFAFEHRPWSTFGDAEKVAVFNPLRRVPTVVLDDGEVLIESGAILDHFDEQAGPARALCPRSGPSRRRVLKVCALATGLGDKAVSLIYERVLHREVSPRWVDRCRTQIAGVLDALEADRATTHTRWWLGDALTHADIAVGCVLRFTGEAHPGLFDADRWPALARHARASEALPDFQACVQPFIPPPRCT